jgi:O-acetyl-ADP-ribose deacetylase (regulator of RNase III)
VFRAAAEKRASVHMPRIGAGHGGGAWPVIRDMIATAAARWRVQTTIYRHTSAAPAAEQDALFTDADGSAGPNQST